MKFQDGLLFPIMQPMVARDPAIVLVSFSVTPRPFRKRGGAQPQPSENLSLRELRFFGPAPDIIDDRIANFVGNPFAV